MAIGFRRKARQHSLVLAGFQILHHDIPDEVGGFIAFFCAHFQDSVVANALVAAEPAGVVAGPGKAFNSTAFGYLAAPPLQIPWFGCLPGRRIATQTGRHKKSPGKDPGLESVSLKA